MRCLVLAAAALFAGGTIQAGEASPPGGKKAGAEGSQAATARENAIRGIYFLPQGEGARILELAGRTFRSLSSADDGAPSVAGACDVYDKKLAFRYFDGKQDVSFETTYTVIGNDLWIGVFVKTGRPGEPEAWFSQCSQPRFFGRFEGSLPPDWVEWSGDKWRAALPPDGKPKKSVKKAGLPAEASGVRIVREPGQAGPDGRFFPVFTPAGADALDEAWNTGTYGCRNTAASYVPFRSFGIAADEKWTLETEIERSSKASGRAAPGAKEFFASLCSQPASNSGRNSYERKGDAIIAPWSIRLGPVGLAPRTLKPEEAAGAWVSESDPKAEVVIEAPKGEPAAAPDAELHFRRDFGDLGARLRKGTYRPDARGIARETIPWNCMMNHMDRDYEIYWIPLSPDRMARYMISGGCDGSESRPRTLVLFRKKKPD